MYLQRIIYLYISLYSWYIWESQQHDEDEHMMTELSYCGDLFINGAVTFLESITEMIQQMESETYREWELCKLWIMFIVLLSCNSFKAMATALKRDLLPTTGRPDTCFSLMNVWKHLSTLTVIQNRVKFVSI